MAAKRNRLRQQLADLAAKLLLLDFSRQERKTPQGAVSVRLLEAPVNDPMQRIQHYVGSSGTLLLEGPDVAEAGPAQQGLSSAMSVP